MKAHVAADDATPLLIFPEGTCVNNEYCVMFKARAMPRVCSAKSQRLLPSSFAFAAGRIWKW
jgi:1-acyl-sn-glycerol-3-phosphate acyltransferase